MKLILFHAIFSNNYNNLTLHVPGGGAHCARPSENMLLFFTVWSEGPQILVQFIYHSDIGCTESLEPKVCLRKKLEHVF